MCRAVYRQASNINMLKDGMTIEATHVRKKQLHQYLPAELLHRGKKKVIIYIYYYYLDVRFILFLDVCICSVLCTVVIS